MITDKLKLINYTHTIQSIEDHWQLIAIDSLIHGYIVPTVQ